MWRASAKRARSQHRYYWWRVIGVERTPCPARRPRPGLLRRRGAAAGGKPRQVGFALAAGRTPARPRRRQRARHPGHAHQGSTTQAQGRSSESSVAAKCISAITTEILQRDQVAFRTILAGLMPGGRRNIAVYNSLRWSRRPSARATASPPGVPSRRSPAGAAEPPPGQSRRERAERRHRAFTPGGLRSTRAVQRRQCTALRSAELAHPRRSGGCVRVQSANSTTCAPSGLIKAAAGSLPPPVLGLRATMPQSFCPRHRPAAAQRRPSPVRKGSPE